MSKRPYRLDSSSPELGDLRFLYRQIRELGVRLDRVEAELHLIKTKLDDDRRYMGQIISNLNGIIEMMTMETESSRKR